MFFAFILAVALLTFSLMYSLFDIARYIGHAIILTRTDSTVKRVEGMTAIGAYVNPLLVAFIVWYCWTH